MKKRIGLFIVLAMISGICFAQEKMKITAKGVSQSVSVGATIQYNDESCVYLIYLPKEEDEEYQPNGNLVIETLKSKYTEKEYLAAAQVALQNLFKADIIEFGDNYHVVDMDYGTLKIRQIQFVKIKDKKAYVFSYGMTADRFDAYRPMFTEMFSSVEID